MRKFNHKEYKVFAQRSQRRNFLSTVLCPFSLVPLIAIIFFIGCTPKPIDINIKQADPKLVISSQIIPNQIMFVSVMRSFSALSGQANGGSVSTNFLSGILVSDAFVTVSYNGKKDTLAMVSPGIYASANTLQYNYGVYNLYVVDPVNSLEVTAMSTILPKVTVDTIYPKVQKYVTDTVITVHSEFRDSLNVENYYVISYFNKTGVGVGVDISGYFNNGENQLNTFDIYTDKSFDSTKVTIDKQLNKISANDTIAVVISNISQGYYDFLSAYKRAGELFNQISGEPINYPTNIIGGYGYFNTHYPDYRIFYLKNY